MGRSGGKFKEQARKTSQKRHVVDAGYTPLPVKDLAAEIAGDSSYKYTATHNGSEVHTDVHPRRSFLPTIEAMQKKVAAEESQQREAALTAQPVTPKKSSSLPATATPSPSPPTTQSTPPRHVTSPDFRYDEFDPAKLVTGEVKFFNDKGFGFAVTKEHGELYFHQSDICFCDLEFKHHEPDTEGISDTPWIRLSPSRFQRRRLEAASGNSREMSVVNPPRTGDLIVIQPGMAKTGKVKGLYWTHYDYYEKEVNGLAEVAVYCVMEQKIGFGGVKIAPKKVWVGFDCWSNETRYRKQIKGDETVKYQWYMMLPLSEKPTWVECEDPRRRK